MATLQDITVPVGSWTNVHTSRGLVAGAQVYVQNKTSAPILLNTSIAMPSDTSGMVVAGNDYTFLLVTPGTNEYLWTRSFSTTTGTMGVQQ
jgi:hypothetical protein